MGLVILAVESMFDLGRTMPNVELIRAIFIYYNMFKFEVD